MCNMCKMFKFVSQHAHVSARRPVLLNIPDSKTCLVGVFSLSSQLIMCGASRRICTNTKHLGPWAKVPHRGSIEAVCQLSRLQRYVPPP